MSSHSECLDKLAMGSFCSLRTYRIQDMFFFQTISMLTFNQEKSINFQKNMSDYLSVFRLFRAKHHGVKPQRIVTAIQVPSHRKRQTFVICERLTIFYHNAICRKLFVLSDKLVLKGVAWIEAGFFAKNYKSSFWTVNDEITILKVTCNLNINSVMKRVCRESCELFVQLPVIMSAYKCIIGIPIIRSFVNASQLYQFPV